MSGIERVIDEMAEYIDSCKSQPLSNTKIIVVKEDLEDFLAELRARTPDEIKKYQKIIRNKDAIIADAEEQAKAIINEAQIHTEELVNEHEIMQRAYAQANELIDRATAEAQGILDRATEEANGIRYGAVQYTDDMLSNLQLIIEHSINSNKNKYEALLNELSNELDIVVSNRNELNPQQEDTYSEVEEVAASED